MLAGLAFLSLTAGVQAEGLVYKLPEDGSWARFAFEMTSRSDGMDKTEKGLITVSSVGVAKEGNEPCRWIEFKVDAEQEKEVVKLLVPEKYLKRGEEPLAHIVRAWVRRGDAAPEALSEPARHEALPALLAGPIKEVKELEKEVVDSGLGKLECPGLTGRADFKIGQDQVDVTHHVRLHDKAPFGVVVCRLDFKVTRGGQLAETGTIAFKIVDAGKNATSELPDRQ